MTKLFCVQEKTDSPQCFKKVYCDQVQLSSQCLKKIYCGQVQLSVLEPHLVDDQHLVLSVRVLLTLESPNKTNCHAMNFQSNLFLREVNNLYYPCSLPPNGMQQHPCSGLILESNSFIAFNGLKSCKIKKIGRTNLRATV